MTTEENEVVQTADQPDAIALETLFTPHQIRLLVAFTENEAKALRQPNASTRKRRFFERVDELNESHTPQSLLEQLQTSLTSIETTLTVEGYAVQCNFYDCDEQSSQQFTAALRTAFPTSRVYLQRDEKTATERGTCHRYWHLFIPGSEGEPSQATLDALVALPGNIEEPIWVECFAGEQAQLQVIGLKTQGWERLF